MVFKNKLFFSSSSLKSDTSSPDGSSNSPRSFGSSNSPIRSDKKKPKSSSKDDAVHTTPTSFASSFTCRQTQFGFCDTGVVSGTESDKDSLWAVQESFFSLNRGDSNKDSSAASSNLSRPGGGGNDGNLSSGKPGSSGKKKEVANKIGFLDGVVGDNGSNFDTMSIGSGRCESPLGRTGGLRSSDVCTPETSYDCENPKESESPRFQAILCLTSAPRKRYPADIKSFSHDLNFKGLVALQYIYIYMD
ncbi:hypothetical protein JRO89_XS13G0031400 [Xanthoceras sorbifolium]|uniref:Uncharacterized protein n=1 Tax=Xanthoceras sorbifolium TaxID=99658 RepID=A0ABQ8H682_9ROSI|nr:hypothetical protein JRO89_XS13G0031400 [Xanthoceras sorbifolium]